MQKKSIIEIVFGLNAIEILGISLTLVMAFLLQFVQHELPCPLCLLQRIGFILVSFGFLLNLRFGFRPSHYAVSLLSALFTSFVALRQIALHVIPGTGSYGSPLFGFHLYTWSFIVSILIIIATTLILSIDRQYLGFLNSQNQNNENNINQISKKIRHARITHSLFALVMIIILINVFSVLSICGLGDCPENPSVIVS